MAKHWAEWEVKLQIARDQYERSRRAEVEAYLAQHPEYAAQVTRSPSLRPSLSIREAIQKFLESQRQRVGMAGGDGVKTTTFNSLERKLWSAVGFSIANTTTRMDGRCPIDIEKPLNSLTGEDLINFKNFWMARPGGMAVRSAINYCLTFKTLLKWADEQDSLGFTPPKATDRILNFRGKKKPNVIQYNPGLLKQVRAVADERTWLYCLLALNCGMYQSDIGGLQFDELKYIHKEPFLVWRRRKLMGVDDDAGVEDVNGDLVGADIDGHVVTWLFPEVHELLVRHMAPKNNEHGRLLLHKNGGPLWYEPLGGSVRDGVGYNWKKALNKAGVKLPFHQLRKWGWNMVKKFGGGNDDFSRKWAGHAIEGVSRWYNKDEYEDVTAALREYRQQLIQDGVL